MRAWMSRLVSLSIFAIATLSCHARIINYKRRHNMSYFSQFRQNIATMDQSLVAAYLQIVLAIVYEVFFFLSIRKKNTYIQIMIFNKLSNILNCIIIPSYWLYSTHATFQDLWSRKTIFYKKRANFQNRSNSFHMASSSIEPRGPHICETSFTDEDSQVDRKLNVSFFYGVKWN